MGRGKPGAKAIKRLIIQIPCLNEQDHLPETIADLPREIPGIDSIEVLVIDDGSTDRTAEVARELGVHHILRFPTNRGLAAAFSGGLDACVRLGADVIVNTDADNQYRGDDIAALVQPIVAGRADLVIGDRQTRSIAHFSPLKRFLQWLGSAVVRAASNTGASDATSGFRAMNSRAARELFVHNRFTYTVETLIQAGHHGLTVENVTIRTNPKTRESRLFKSIAGYIRRNGLVIVRSYLMYRPMRIFAGLAVLLLLLGTSLMGRFLYFFVEDPTYSGHQQSLLVGVGAVVLAFLVGLSALLAELLATNRRLIEDVRHRVRRIEGGAGEGLEDVTTTGAAAWEKEDASWQDLQMTRPTAGSSATSTTSTAPAI
jgi:glycosyltransferase involved in cell wall biosynthesis